MLTHTKYLFFPLLLVMYEIATYLSNDMYLPALPNMMKELHLSTHQAQLTLTMWFLGSASMPFLMGALTDRFGRRNVLLGGGFIYIIATMLAAMAGNEIILLIARFLQGSMMATMLVAGYATIHELYEQKEAIRILALMGSISVLAPALGPLLGAILLLFTDWRGIFWVISLWAFITIVLLYFYMPETLPLEKRRSIQLIALWKQYSRILTNKIFILWMLVEGLLFCSFIAWVSASPLLVIENFHYSATLFGLVQIVVFGAYIYGNYWVKKLLNTVGIQLLIQTGLFIVGLSVIALFSFASLFPHYLSLFLIAVILFSFGSGLCFAPLNRTIIESSDEAMSLRVALFTVFITGFAALGSALSSVFFSGSLISLACIIAIPAILSLINYVVIKHKIN